MSVRLLHPLSASSAAVCGVEAVGEQIRVNTAKQQLGDLYLL